MLNRPARGFIERQAVHLTLSTVLNATGRRKDKVSTLRSKQSRPPGVGVGNAARTVDRTDARILTELELDPRATVMALAQRLSLSRNTVQARLARMESDGVLRGFGARVDPAALGYPIAAIVTVVVRQQMLSEVSDALAEVPEVLEVFGMTGPTDLLVRVVAPDADDLYRIAARILSMDGVDRTDTALVMRRLVDYRISPLLDRLAAPTA
jgi:DNA-binding Lrp family transcriptional regulator